MAKVTVELRNETEMVERVVAKTDFILTLTEDEAKELMSVTGALSPYSAGSLKGPTVTSAIYDKLRKAFDQRGFVYSNHRHVNIIGIKPTWA